MGVNSATKAKFIGKGLTLKTIQSFGLGNRIDVDGNALAFKFLGNGQKNLNEILSDMALHLKQLAYSGGFIVAVIFDGTKRPDCKRASLQRKKERFLNDSNRMYCRFMSLKLKAQYEKEKKQEVKQQLDEYIKECNKLEKVCMRSLYIPGNIGSLFSEKLMMVEACAPNENGGFVEENVLTATFQADSLIAARSVSNLNDFIYGNDSDYLVLLGSECLLLWDMKAKSGKRKKGRGRRAKQNEEHLDRGVSDATQYQVEIYGACNNKMKELQSKLQGKSAGLPDNLEWKEAEQPFFSLPDPVLRVLIALSLGCDVFHGVNSLGPKSIQDKIDKLVSKNEPLVPAFKNMMKKQMKTLNDSIIDTLVSAFLFEPGLVDETKQVGTSYDCNNETPQQQKYVHKPPEGYIFPTFLQSFSCSNESQQQHDEEVATVSTSLQNEQTGDNDPQLCHCIGFNKNGNHTHLKFEGRHTCKHCKNTFCKTCVFVPSRDIPRPTKTRPNGTIYYKEGCEDILCLDCFKAKRFGEEQAATLPTSISTHSSTSSNVSIDRMRRVLNDKTGLQLSNSDASAVEVMDMYEMYISSPLNTHDAIHLAQAKTRVKFPILSSECIDQNNIFERVGNAFPFSDGGRFISDINTVSDNDIPAVLEVITSLLRHDENLIPKNDEANSQSSGDIYIGRYDFLPSMFLNLAYYSRVDSGYRLLDRCARHTCDPKSGSIYYQDASFVKYTDENNKKGKLSIFYFYFYVVV